VNPEFKRNFWVEMTPFRLFAMPVVLLALIAGYGTATDFAPKGMSDALSVLAYLLGWLWATRLAARSVLSEVKEGTWDYQRMSDIGAWNMAWGKLFGATLFPWYGVVICLSFRLWFDWQRPPSEMTHVQAVADLVNFVAAMLVAHCTAFSMSLAWLQKDRTGKTVRDPACVFMGLIAGLSIYGLHKYAGPKIEQAFTYLAVHAGLAGFNDREGILLQMRPRFFGLEIGGPGFTAVSLSLLLGCGLICLYRLLRRELQYRVYPWGLAAFILFFAIYLTGYMERPLTALARYHILSPLHVFLFILFVVSYGGFMVSIFVEAKDAVRYRWLFVALSRRDWREALRLAPVWTLPLVLLWTATFAFVLHMVFGYGRIPPPESLIWLKQPPTLAQYCFTCIGFSLFLMRDLMLVHAMGFLPKSWRPDILSSVLILLIYVLVPFALAQLGYGNLIFLFFAETTSPSWRVLLPPVVEAMILFGIILKCWSALRKGRKTRAAIEEERYGKEEAPRLSAEDAAAAERLGWSG
jgi:hypothetical protein